MLARQRGVLLHMYYAVPGGNTTARGSSWTRSEHGNMNLDRTLKDS
jgi:hypothetical protein